MAIYHCSISNVSRSRGGSACATLAYISGKSVYDERRGETFSYGRQERVITTGTILPESAPADYADPARLFNAIEANETTSNARTAKKVEVALPRELTLEQQKILVESFIRDSLTSAGYCSSYAIHTDTENCNPHCHILVANRPIDKNGDWSIKRKMAYVLDENGDRVPQIDKRTGKQKTDKRGRKQWKRISIEQNALDQRDFLNSIRASWADHANGALRDAGLDERIDHRSNADRGLDAIPTIHEGYAARAIEARGGISPRCEINRKTRHINAVSFEIADLCSAMHVFERKRREQEQQSHLLSFLPAYVALDAGAAFLRHERGYRQRGENSYNSEEHARARTTQELRDVLSYIGIPRGRQSYFCLACGREMERQMRGGKPRSITVPADRQGGSAAFSAKLDMLALGDSFNEFSRQLHASGANLPPPVMSRFPDGDDDGMRRWADLSRMARAEEELKQWKRDL